MAGSQVVQNIFCTAKLDCIKALMITYIFVLQNVNWKKNQINYPVIPFAWMLVASDTNSKANFHVISNVYTVPRQV